MEVLRLMRSKNRCLERWLNHSHEFLAQAQAGDFTQLRGFETQRDAIIKAIGLFDRKLTEVIACLPHEDRTQLMIEGVKLVEADRMRLVEEILVLDQKVIKEVEAEKARLSSSLGNSEKSKNTVKKFKSNWIPGSGEGIDRKL